MNESVLVIGSDKASRQAAMNLANAGFRVFLVPRSIRALRTQLDKTFLTSDCTACVLAPKIIQSYRDGNIRVLNDSEVAELKAYLGNSKVAGRCLVVAQNEGGETKTIFKPSAQVVPNLYVIDSKATPPCKAACPIGLDVQGYIALITQGKFKEALSLIRQKNPLPGVTGRVCTHPCEAQCNRKEVDEPIAIPTLRRFVTDYALSLGEAEVVPVPITKEERIAVIGSGPSGLTAAHDLVKMGYGVTIFEALPVPGGMLAVGIPEYRLPKKVLQAEIEVIQKLGVEIKLNSPVGKDGLTLDSLWKQGYQAIFIAVGAHHSLRLDIPGEELEGIYQGVPFLRDVNLRKEVKVGERVAIVGGGNVAIDAARTALRLGSKKVFIVYRRSRQEMPAYEEEIEAAEQEGVKIHYLAAPVRIPGKDKKITGMECIRMELGEADASGRRRPIPIAGSEFVIDADMVISAIGEVPDISFLPDNKFNITQGKLKVDPRNFTTGVAGIFAGGDVVTGPATVIEAMAAGKRAAIAIDSYLRKRNLPPEEEPLPVVTIDDIDLTDVRRKSRAVKSTIPIEERIAGFKEVNVGFSQEMTIEEANRCLACKRYLSPQECYVLYCAIESS